MGLYNFNPGANTWIWDSWGWQPRNDWTAHPSRTGIFGISGSSEMQPDGEMAPVLSALEGQHWGSADEAIKAMGARPAPNPTTGVNMSENAYNAALKVMGIDPSELPYGQVGQEATARVLQQHGQAIPEYLRPFLPKAAGGGNSAQPGLGSPPMNQQQALLSAGLDFNFSGLEDLGLTRMGYGGQPGPLPGADPMQNSVTGQFHARMQQDNIDKQAQITRDMIRKILLQGQTPKGASQPAVSPAMIRAAAGKGRPVGRQLQANWIDNPY